MARVLRNPARARPGGGGVHVSAPAPGEALFSESPFVVDRAYAAALREKIGRFRAHTGTRKATHLVLVTAEGLRENEHSRDLVQRVVTVSDLFERGAD